MFSRRVEVKNVAGAKNVERAVEYEFKRQIGLLENKQDHGEETRRFDAAEDKTILMRTKDQDYDYRFFQEPDLPDVSISGERVAKCAQTLPELPFVVKKRWAKEYDMSIEDVKIMFNNEWSLALFNECVKTVKPKLAFEWIYKNIYGNAAKKDLDFQEVIEDNFGDEDLIQMLQMIQKGAVSAANAKELIKLKIDGDDRSPQLIAQSLGFLGGPISDDDLGKMSDLVIEDNKSIAQKVKAGETGKLQALVGEMMKRTNKKGDPKKINEILIEKIKNLF